MKEKTNIYIPISNDPIDNRLADYLNSIKDENKLRILFIREGEGVYRFG
jgi:disulfide oxidoreductase YuzD